jgi:superfamily II DNA or RNA helicase
MVTQARIRQRLLIEELTRKRRSDDAQRFVEVFRRSTIDPNPHQIEAAMFALRRIPEGGAMLCDEVGLGKTIEAGLVITQLRASGKGHILIIVPLALARQWQVELQDLFSLPSTILGPDSPESTERGIYIIGREFASTGKGQKVLRLLGIWDLIVIDEAHELFATIYNRFSKTNGEYQTNLSKGSARRAAQIRELLEGFPILLLTATPIQNNLYEMWGLVQYIDPEQRVLGKFNEFCMLFVGGEGGREIMPNMEDTLRQRLSLVLKRTLRRQAQPFMKQPFRERHVVTANFSPEKLEADLYRLVQLWLSQDRLAAYRSGHRALMALQLRRRMASSLEALISTLAGMKQRMLKMQETGRYPGKSVDDDFEFEDVSEAEDDHRELDMALLAEDLAEVGRMENLARQAMGAGVESKKRKLLEVIRQIQQRSIDGVVSDKVVIFTESVKTLDSLVTYLEENGFADQVTTFSGTNVGPIPERAWKNWFEQVGQHKAPVDSGAAMRAALVHEFKTRTSIFIATEAGAKGLNLQFCNCLINYDLPWNPQRIEQRIGRVHRYGQLHDVIIVNFINLSNQAEQRVYELLNEKLHVFTEALGASDTILNSPEIALNLEMRINELLNKCRTQEEIQDAFDRLLLDLDAAERQLHDAKLVETKQLLGELDGTVQARLGALETQLQPALSQYDQTLLEIIDVQNPVEQVASDGLRTVFRWNGRLYHLGHPEPSANNGEPLHFEHDLVQSEIRDCIATTSGVVQIADLSIEGRWEIYKLEVEGLELEERVVVVGEVPYPDWKDCVADLQVAMQDLKQEAEMHQRGYVERLLRQISSRREDISHYRTGVMAQLTKKLEAADRAKRLATTPQAISKAQAQRKKILHDIEKLHHEHETEARKQLDQLDQQEQRIRLLQFVEIKSQLLFTIEAVPVTSGV